MAKLLHRSKRYKVFGGVAGGIAEYFNIDPVIIRAIFVISTLGWGISILVYCVLWIIIPDESVNYVRCKDQENPEAGSNDFEGDMGNHPECFRSFTTGRIFLAIVLILLGSFMIIDKFVYWMDFQFFWAVILIAVGLLIVFKDKIRQFQGGKK